MKRNRQFTSLSLSVACLALLASPTVSTAQTLQACLGQQLAYAGTSCRGMARCYVKAMRRQVPVDPGCVPERKAEVGARFTLIEDKGDCLVKPGGPTSADMLETFTDAQVAAITLPGGRCASKKMGAIGRECKQLLRCYTRAVNNSEPVDPFCLGKASAKLLKVFDRVEQKLGVDCPTTADASARDSDTLTIADDLYAYLRDIGTTTTTTTVSTSTTTTLATDCPEDGSFTPCVAYRDNPACASCVDLVGGFPQSQCSGAGPTCDDAFQNEACGHAINTETTCGPTCCP